MTLSSGADAAEAGLPAIPELPIFDEQPLLVLREVVAFDNFMGLIEGWCVSLGARIERLVQSAASADLAALKVIAHDMSGTCGCFGALRLGELAWELELVCLAADLPRARTLVRTMVPITAATRAALRRRYFFH
jgi:hypothetical protein